MLMFLQQKISMKKIGEKKLFFVGILKATAEKRRRIRSRMCNPVCGSKDPDLYQNVFDSAFDIRSQIGNYCMCIDRGAYLQINSGQIST
jgi:hypothetical protein